ncbi:Crp/Fnr family transcriptional regulator [Candidatus Daviesbacteria bacterium]|nr:Crp/Fnr family transcriptional regulator [Candidatus Daviesbacteria bacterium]
MEKGAFQKLEDFFSKNKKISYKKGETIIRPDEPVYNIYYLSKGYTRLYSISKNAQELTFIIYKPEDFFPLIPAVNKTTASYYTEAMTPVEVYPVSKDEFMKFITQNSDVLLEITKRTLTRFSGVLTRMEYAMFGNAGSKVASIILICVDRFGVKHPLGIFIPVPLTHQDIANLLGIARETVSIEMKKLENLDLIDYQGKNMIVKSVDKLKEHSVIGA